MSEMAKGSFQITRWDPVVYDEGDGATLSRVSVGKEFRGDLEATSTAELLTVMDAGGNPAVYVAVERVTGTLHGRAGTFVLHHTAPGTAGEPIVIRIIPDTGTGDLRGITGALAITGDTDGGHEYEIVYEISTASLS
jgi:uncharacterized protein DUF3224